MENICIELPSTNYCSFFPEMAHECPKQALNLVGKKSFREFSELRKYGIQASHSVCSLAAVAKPNQAL